MLRLQATVGIFITKPYCCHAHGLLAQVQWWRHALTELETRSARGLVEIASIQTRERRASRASFYSLLPNTKRSRMLSSM
jgi:hypothetical protein